VQQNNTFHQKQKKNNSFACRSARGLDNRLRSPSTYPCRQFCRASTIYNGFCFYFLGESNEKITDRPGCCGVVSAPAFAATANVDVYGVMNAAVSYVDDRPAINDIQFSPSAAASASRALKIWAGMKAFGRLNRRQLREQSGSLSGRNSFVGLSALRYRL